MSTDRSIMQRLWHRLCPRPAAPRLAPAAWAFLLVVAALLLAPGVATIPPMDRDEARYAQASRQMLETGDIVDIRFQEDARHVKPAGTYWLQASSAALFGGAEAPIGAYRLPSLLAAIGAVLLTAWFGARTFGAAVGLTAALLLASSLVLQVEARTAKTDALLLLAVLTGQIALARIALRDSAGPPRFFGAPLVFWAAQALGVLIKGPIILLVAGTTALAFGLWQRDRALAARLRILPGLAVMLALAAPWLVLITLQEGVAFYEQALGRALFSKVGEGQEGHGAPFGFHAAILPLTFWPGALLLVPGILAAWYGRREPAVRFLVAWVVPTWVVFEAVATKLPHYTLPTFPAIALLMALGLRDAAALIGTGWRRRVHLALASLVAVVAVALAAVPAVAAFVVGTDGWVQAVAVLATLAGLAVAVAGFRLARQPSSGRLVAVVVLTAAFYAPTFHIVLPGTHAIWPSARVADHLARVEGCDRLRVTTAGFREPSNVFLLGTDTLLATSGEEAARFLLAHPTCGLAVVDRRQRDGFEATLDAQGATTRSLATVTGTNISNGRDLELDLRVLAGSPLQLATP
ncbi:MAG: ArnT family glycosyltransferase [Pseudomonadota bacterium]